MQRLYLFVFFLFFKLILLKKTPTCSYPVNKFLDLLMLQTDERIWLLVFLVMFCCLQPQFSFIYRVESPSILHMLYKNNMCVVPHTYLNLNCCAQHTTIPQLPSSEHPRMYSSFCFTILLQIQNFIHVFVAWPSSVLSKH